MGDVFLWNAASKGGYWPVPANWIDVSTPGLSGLVVPASGDAATIAGGTGTQFQVLAGTGAASSVAFYGNTMLAGIVAAGTLAIGATPTLTPYTNAEALDILASAGIVVAATTGLNANLEIDGGVLLSQGAMTQKASFSGMAEVLLVNTGAMEANNWTIATGHLFVDATATAEVGTAGTDTAAGRVVIDPGFTLAFNGGAALVDSGIVANGTLAAGGNSSLTSYGIVNGAVSGTGVLAVGTLGQLSINGAVSGLASISVAGGSSLGVVGTVNGIGGISLGVRGDFSASDSLSNVGPINVGASGDLELGPVSNAGPILLGSKAHAVFGSVNGGGSITAAGQNDLVFQGTIAGVPRIDTGVGTTLELGGNDIDAPIALGGSDTILLHSAGGPGSFTGVSIGGSVSGFDGSDLLQSVNPAGVAIVTAATLSGGQLTLTADAAAIHTLVLAGNFSGQEFLTNAAGLPNGTTDIALASTIVTGLVPTAGTVTGGTGVRFQAIHGTGSVTGAVAFTGNNALEGQFAIGTLSVAASAVAGTVNALDVEPGGSLSVAASATIAAGFEDDGGNIAIGGNLTIDSETAIPQMLVLNGGTVRAANLSIVSLTHPSAFGPAPSVRVDSASALVLGSASAVIGSVVVSPGAVLVSNFYGATVDAPIVNNGIVAVTGTSNGSLGTGAISGAGTVLVSAGLSMTIGGDVKGQTLIVAGVGAQLGITGAVLGNGAMGSDTKAVIGVTGAVVGLGLVQIGDGSSFTVGSDVALSGALQIGTSVNSSGQATRATLEGNVSGIGSMEVGNLAQVSLAGTLSSFTSVVVDSAATLSVLGADAGVPISLAGHDLLSFNTGAALAGVINGFDTTDLLQNADPAATYVGDLITGASFSAGKLTLTADGVAIKTLSLAGSFTQPFLTHAVGLPAGISDIALPSSAVAGLPTSNGTITGETGTGFQLITGNGTATNLVFVQNNALSGNFSAQNVTVSGTATISDNALDLEHLATLAVAGTMGVQSYMEIDGGTLSAGALVLGGDSPAELLVVDGGAVQADSLTLAAASATSYGGAATLAVDGAGRLEIGHAGAALAGQIVIDAGSTLSANVSTGTIVGSLIINGVLADALTSALRFEVFTDVRGPVSGSGEVTVASKADLELGMTVANLSSISVASLAQFAVVGAASNLGAITVGSNGTADFLDALNGFTRITTGTSSELSISGNLSGTGPIIIGPQSTARFGGTITGVSSIEIGAGSSLSLTGADLGVPIVMDPGSTLEIGLSTPVTGVITGFAAGNLIQVIAPGGNTIVTDASYAGGTVTLRNDGVVLNHLMLSGNYASTAFLTNAAGVSVSANLTNLTLAAAPACFVTGTRIATPQGDIPVEALRVGDRVCTHDGRIVPVVWLGHRGVDCAHASAHAMRPVRVAANAIAPGQPLRDLFLSPDHALFIDDALIPVRCLINGATIAPVDAGWVRYWHVELPVHDVLLAEGVPAESYLDTGNRQAFSNAGTMVASRRGFATGVAATSVWAASGYAPLLCAGSALTEVRKRMYERAAALGHHPMPPVMRGTRAFAQVV